MGRKVSGKSFSFLLNGQLTLETRSLTNKAELVGAYSMLSSAYNPQASAVRTKGLLVLVLFQSTTFVVLS